MKLISWNVNGVRAAVKKGLLDWLESEKPDILCLQETKAHKEQLTSEILEDHGYHTYWHSGEKKGYSGVATFSREEPLYVQEFAQFKCNRMEVASKEWGRSPNNVNITSE